MPIRPSPLRYTCPACGWSKTVAPQSDALGPGDFYGACPRCHHSPLQTQSASPAAVLGDVLQSVERLWKSMR